MRMPTGKGGKYVVITFGKSTRHHHSRNVGGGFAGCVYFEWYIVPMFLVVLYIIVTELKNKRYNIVFGAAAFWLMDVFNETWNAMVYATTGQPVWGTTAAGGSALQILVGYNIEISFMFFVLGIVACKLLRTSPESEGAGFWDGNKNWLNDPNNMYYKANVAAKNLLPEERRLKVKP